MCSRLSTEDSSCAAADARAAPTLNPSPDLRRSAAALAWRTCARSVSSSLGVSSRAWPGDLATYLRGVPISRPHKESATTAKAAHGRVRKGITGGAPLREGLRARAQEERDRKCEAPRRCSSGGTTEFEFSRRRRRRSDVAWNAGAVAVPHTGPRHILWVAKGSLCCAGKGIEIWNYLFMPNKINK